MAKNLGILNDMEVLGPLVDWKGRRVLDIGCGPGYLSRALAGLGATVTGFEPDPVQAERNRQAELLGGVTFEAGYRFTNPNRIRLHRGLQR